MLLVSNKLRAKGSVGVAMQAGAEVSFPVETFLERKKSCAADCGVSKKKSDKIYFMENLF